MWIDEEGTAHTVAPPDWRRVVAFYGPLPPQPADELLDVLEGLRVDLYEQIGDGALSSGGPVGRLPDAPIAVDSHVLTEPDRLSGVLAGIDVWWRLDVLDAIEECVAEA